HRRGRPRSDRPAHALADQPPAHLGRGRRHGRLRLRCAQAPPPRRLLAGDPDDLLDDGVDHHHRAMSSGLGKYSPADFGIHMIVHVTLNMLMPSLLVGGGPITLLLRATTGTGRLGRQIHARVNQLIAWKGLRMLLHPLFVFVVYVASY